MLGSICRSKFKNLRDTFIKKWKRLVRSSPELAADSILRDDNLSFVLPNAVAYDESVFLFLFTFDFRMFREIILSDLQVRFERTSPRWTCSWYGYCHHEHRRHWERWTIRPNYRSQSNFFGINSIKLISINFSSVARNHTEGDANRYRHTWRYIGQSTAWRYPRWFDNVFVGIGVYNEKFRPRKVGQCQARVGNDSR